MSVTKGMPLVGTPQSETFTIYRTAGVEPEQLLAALKADGRTGSLTVHLGQGRIGSVEWKEKAEPTGNGKH